MTTPATPLYKWYDAVAGLTTPEQLTRARQTWNKREGHLSNVDKVGLAKALTALRNRAKALNCIELRDGSFRQSLTAAKAV